MEPQPIKTDNLALKRGLPFDRSASKAWYIYKRRLTFFGYTISVNVTFIFAHLLPWPIKLLLIAMLSGGVAGFWGLIDLRLPRHRRGRDTSSAVSVRAASEKWERALSSSLLFGASALTFAALLTLLNNYPIQTEVETPNAVEVDPCAAFDELDETVEADPCAAIDE